jgi:hypothetical protein
MTLPISAPAYRSEFDRGTAMTVVAAMIAVLFAGSTVLTPLYVVYKQAFGFSQITLTLIYAVYVVGNLLALLMFGRVSDSIGRRPVTLAAMGVALMSALVFLTARNVVSLDIARILSGFAIGVGAGTGTAWLAELIAQEDKSRAALVATSTNFLGLGLGALASGMLAEYAPLPLRLTFIVYLAALAVVAFLMRPFQIAPAAEQRATPAAASGRTPAAVDPTATRPVLQPPVTTPGAGTPTTGGPVASTGSTPAATNTPAATPTPGAAELLAEATRLLDAGQTDRAIELLEALRRQDPNTPNLTETLARAYVAQGQGAVARDDLDAADGAYDQALKVRADDSAASPASVASARSVMGVGWKRPGARTTTPRSRRSKRSVATTRSIARPRSRTSCTPC